MTTRITELVRELFLRWDRYSALQFNAPLTIQLFHDGR